MRSRLSRWRDVLVMLVFALTAIALAFAGYARVHSGQYAPAVRTTPAPR